MSLLNYKDCLRKYLNDDIFNNIDPRDLKPSKNKKNKKKRIEYLILL